jgi:uncharacterized iron-regulated protein
LFALPLMAAVAPARDGLAAQAVPALPDLTSFQLMRTDSGAPTPVSADQAADALKNYDVVFMGEWHDHTGNHLAEMALLRALYARAPDLALSMEMFERDVQNVVDDYLASRIGEDNFRQRGRAWGNYAESYRPLVEYAKEHHLPVIAANVPGAVVRCVGIEGPAYLARMAPDKRGQAAAELHLQDGPYKDKFLRFLDESGSHGPDADKTPEQKKDQSDRAFASQVARDDTMAESIFLSLQKNPGRKVVHVTGAFHVEEALGTVERLKLRAPQLKIALVVPAEAEHPDSPAVDPSDAKNANFVFLLRASPKEYVSDAEKKEADDRIRAMLRGQTAPNRCPA